MFNKSIVVALIVCACYLGTSDARPGLGELTSGPVGAALTGATTGMGAGAVSGLASSLTGGLTGANQGPLAPASAILASVANPTGLVG
ncbi:uncharacterized protein [Drosophila takahashii]|uniref:uncharacterized protein n=1 Tax=Drosophila takahashii TaxID=29030 RepID=UPI0038995CAE